MQIKFDLSNGKFFHSVKLKIEYESGEKDPSCKFRQRTSKTKCWIFVTIYIPSNTNTSLICQVLRPFIQSNSTKIEYESGEKDPSCKIG